MATCWFCADTGGVETLYIIPSSKIKTWLLLLCRQFWSSSKAKALWTKSLLMYIIIHLIFRCESCLYGKLQHERLWKSSWISWLQEIPWKIVWFSKWTLWRKWNVEILAKLFIYDRKPTRYSVCKKTLKIGNYTLS